MGIITLTRPTTQFFPFIILITIFWHKKGIKNITTNYICFITAFALETHNGKNEAKRKMKQKGADFIVLLKVKAPYGKFVNQGWGPSISFKWGWILQEIISPISFSFFFLWTIQEKGFVVWIFFIIWNLHYINRSIIFPLRKKEHKNTPKCPVVIILSAIFFNLINGFINGYFLGKIAQYNFDYILSFNFIFGILILIIGIIINTKSYLNQNIVQFL